MFSCSIYDRLFTQRIDSTIKALISNALGNHFPSLDAVWLIQRWHPHNVAWAESWTDLVFEFLKPLSRTHLLTNSEINGSAYGFEPEYTADLPEELNLPEFPNELTVKVKKGKTGSISWIERSHEVLQAPYCERLTNPITCWHRSQKIITAKNEDIEVKVNSSQMLINSVVLQEAELVGLSNPQKALILYEFLDKSLEEIYDQLNISECKVLTRIDVSLFTEFGVWEKSRKYVYYSAYYPNSLEPARTKNYFQFFNPLFQKVPNHYHYTHFQRDEEIKGKPLNLKILVNGDSITVELSLEYFPDFFQQWQENYPSNQSYPVSGYDLYSEPFETKNPVLAFSFPVNPVSDHWNAELVSTTNNVRLGDLWTSFYSSYPPLHLSLATAREISSPDIEKKGYRFVTKLREPRLIETNYLRINLQDSIDRLEGEAIEYITADSQNSLFRCSLHWYLLEFLKDQYSENGYVYGEGVYVSRSHNKGFFFNSYFDVLPFSPDCDPFLFTDGEIGLFSNDLMISMEVYRKNVTMGDTDGPDFYRYENPESFDRRTELKRRHASKITILNSNPQIPEINFVPLSDDVETVGTWETRADVSIIQGQDTEANYWNYLEAVTTITLNRSFRFNDLDGVNVLVTESQNIILTDEQSEDLLDAFDSPYIEGQNNDVSITIENTTINFTRPFFDPDPDNGDIMPDSKRIIEIHSALQADKYGNDEKDPNAARVANLGWLIEKIGHVLGLHFKSDGAMVKIPNTKWVKLGDTIPEEYQIEQWGKNDWTNSNKETAKGVGLAYEVNSNYFGKDKFGKQTIEEGGYVLVHSLPQLIEIIGDDLDRALGWQDLGANVLPKADGTGYITYQGLHSLLMEVAYMLSAMSINTQHAHTLGLKNNAILQELLGAIGLPVEPKTIPIKLMGQDAKIPYPGFSAEGASLIDFLIWILSNQALTTASHLSIKEQE